MNARIVGRLVAVLLVLAVAIIILVSWASSRGPVRSSATESIGATPEFEQDWAESGLEGAAPEQMVRAGEKWAWRRVAEDGHVEYLIEAERLDPLDGGRFSLTSPVAWFYPRDASPIRVTAASGEFIWPRGGEPESGDLRGGVRIERFETQGDNSPDLTIRTPALLFERTLGQIEAPQRVEIDAAGLAFRGEGLTIRVSEYRDPESDVRRHRLNLVRVEQGEEIRFDPTRQRRTSARSDNSSTDTVSEGISTTPHPNADQLDFYRAVFSSDVTLSRDSQRLSSERAEIFALTIDGDLPSDAVRPIHFREVMHKASPATSSSDSTNYPQSTLEDIQSSQEVILTWSGFFELRPIETRPEELAQDTLAVRFFSPETSTVTLEDQTSGLRATGAALRYAMSSARFDLSGVAGEVGVNILLPDRAELIAGRISLDLYNSPHASLAVTSPGLLRVLSENAGPQNRTQLEWAGRADVAFDLIKPQDADATIILRDIALDREIRAISPNGSIRSNTLNAIFTDTPLSSSLQRLHATGDVELTTAQSASLAAQEIQAFFDPGPEPNRPVLSHAIADGDVRATDNQQWIEADRLQARFSKPIFPDTNPEPIWVEAAHNVRASDGQGLLIDATLLRADLLMSSAEITGSPSHIEQSTQEGRYTLSANSMTMTDTIDRVNKGELSPSSLERSLTIFGPGEATYHASEDGNSAEHARITWRDAMEYDAISGWILIDGDIHAEHHPNAFEEQISTAHSAKITLVPYGRETLYTDPDTGSPLTILSVRLDATDIDPAEILIRRFPRAAPSSDQRMYEGLLALRSARINADTTTQVLSTPGAGLLLIEDRRTVSSASQQPTAPAAGDIRGTSLFEWKGEMAFDRRAGEAQMLRSVKVRHLPPDASKPTVLLSERVRADFTPLQIDTHDKRPSLERILADQAVYLWHLDLQLIADAIEYRATQEEIIVDAVDGNRVTINNTSTGQRLTADRLIVDRHSGQWRAIGGSGSGAITGNTIREVQ